MTSVLLGLAQQFVQGERGGSVYRRIKVVAAVMLVCVLGGCGGGGGGSDAADTHGSRAPSGDAKATPDVPRLAVPAAFDGTKGWAQSATPKGTFAVAPTPGLAVTVTKAADGYVLTAKDLGTGAVRWSTKPWWPFDSVRGELPRPQVVTTGGKDYVALSISGTPGEDALTNSKPTVRIAIYPADSSGDALAPARTVDIPAAEPSALPSAQGAQLVYFGDQQAVTVVDVVSGKTTLYADDALKAPDPRACWGCGHGIRTVGITSRGPLVQGDKPFHFWVPGAWYGDSNVPLARRLPAAWTWQPSLGQSMTWSSLAGQRRATKPARACGRYMKRPQARSKHQRPVPPAWTIRAAPTRKTSIPPSRPTTATSWTGYWPSTSPPARGSARQVQRTRRRPSSPLSTATVLLTGIRSRRTEAPHPRSAFPSPPGRLPRCPPVPKCPP